MRSGEGIVEEMYVFEDKGGRKLALRPEITAAVVRMYINEAKVAPKPLRWCYFADCFRYQRPRKGGTASSGSLVWNSSALIPRPLMRK